MEYLKYIIPFVIGFGIAFLFFKPQVKESIVEVVTERVDTVYTEPETDTIFIDRVRLKTLIDTVYYSEPFKAQISQYKGLEEIEYGTISWMAETTGELTKMDIVPNISVPVITKEVERVKTITKTRDLRGLYIGGSVSNSIDWKAGASYVDRDWQVNYDYQPSNKMHWAGIKRRIF